MPRIELSCSVRLRHDGNAGVGRVVNISQGGICVTTRAMLPLDADVIVSLPGLPAAAGVVKWADGDQYGIGFNRVFAIDELMAFLREQQRDELKQAAG